MNKEFSCSLRSVLLIKALFLSLSSCAWGKDYFDPALLSISGGQGQIASLDQFSEAGTTPQGKYLVDVYINQIDKKEHMVTFSPGKNNKIRPELTPAFLKTLGVNIASVPALKIVPENEPLDDIRKYIPDSQVKFNFSKLRLDISVPQIAMLTTVQGYVDPEYWDEGIPAAVLNYNINGSVNRYKGGSFTGESKQTNLFANWYGGLNWRAWRLRGNATWSYNDHASAGDFNSRYQKVDLNSVYLQRDIIALKSNLLMGENSTGGDVFDSFPFRGVQLTSSEQMQPDSLRGFAPLISGVARTNARITVQQYGNIIYQTYVAPGPFRITDLYQTGQGGDLTVTIREADGEVRTQKIAWSTLAVMRRAGSYQYEVTAGRFDPGRGVNANNADFLLASWIIGLPHNLTLYSGAIMADHYNSLVGGAGFSLGDFGAISADITTASARLHDVKERKSGESYRLRYSKSMISTGTSIDLSAYRYSTTNYYNFTDFNYYQHNISTDLPP